MDEFESRILACASRRAVERRARNSTRRRSLTILCEIVIAIQIAVKYAGLAERLAARYPRECRDPTR